jgi:DNA-binding GntR family transcriptional regulator
MVLHYASMNHSSPMNQAQPLKIKKVPASLRQQVLGRLREAIISGYLPPGARLIERELTTEIGVSRTVLREALRQLEAEHLVEVIPNKGPFVRTLSRDEAEDLYRIRVVLHGLAARICAENADEKSLEQLNNALESVINAYENEDSEQILDAKTSFYEALYEGTRSESLSAMLGILQARIARWRALGIGHPHRSNERSKASVSNLRALVDAVKRRDTDAAESLMVEEDKQAGQEVSRLLQMETTNEKQIRIAK